MTAATSTALAGREHLSGVGEALDDLYDFVFRVVRDRGMAARVLQRMVADADAVDNLAAVGIGLYCTARAVALDELGRAKRARQAGLQDREGLNFTQLDSKRLEDPASVLFDRELVELVWDCAASLERADYSLLDLAVRRGFPVHDLDRQLDARGSVMRRISSVRATFSGAVTAVLVGRRWRSNCPQLDKGLAPSEAMRDLREMRRIVGSHLQSCGECRDAQARFVAPAEVLRGLARMPTPRELRVQLARRAERAVARSARSPRLRRLTFGIL